MRNEQKYRVITRKVMVDDIAGELCQTHNLFFEVIVGRLVGVCGFELDGFGVFHGRPPAGAFLPVHEGGEGDPTREGVFVGSGGG